ncbi:CopG family ribbon-helix-helix protein [Maricaulis sp.]|uniref:CopG family ribbon-helix-helix protein n=1 Tax=Maricaulis sp. TaxID=1486257 RepID=UPI002634925E|nr:CopG family ribbon-helix-helix protein [Maricaulis sp.]
MKNISIRIDDAALGKLDDLAKTQDRSRNWVVKEALQQYFDRQDWILEAIEDGIRDADAGNVVPHEQVMAEVNAIIEAARKK